MGKISLQNNDRVFICGKTGSGKTYLAERITAKLQRLIVLDGKGTLTTWKLDTWNNRAISDLKMGNPGRYRVLAPLSSDPVNYWNDLLYTLYHIGNLTIYIDELYALTVTGEKPPAMLHACYTRGRELGLGIWAATQRPTWIPLYCLSESEHFFIFRLQLEEDRNRLAAFCGEEVKNKISDIHGFYYYNVLWDDPEYRDLA